MSATAKTHLLPCSVGEWVATVRRALRLNVDELHLPEHFFLKEIGTGRRYSHLRLRGDFLREKRSATLVLLSPPPSGVVGRGFQEMCITLTKRAPGLRRHGGQISFPGGSIDSGESCEMAARREAVEEVGIRETSYTVIGSLHPIDSVEGRSNVTPIVAVAESPITPICNSPTEVKSILFLHLSRLLLHSEQTHCRLIKHKSVASRVPSYFPCFFANSSQVSSCKNVCSSHGVSTIPEDGDFLPMLPADFPGELVWGLTSFVICELLVRLSMVLGLGQPHESCKEHSLRCSPVVARDPELPLGSKR